jgi:hypothetical protein
MAATTDQLIALGEDAHFRQRVRTLMLLEAGAVYNEPTPPANHTARALFASKVAQNPGIADTLAPALATRTNIAASNVTYDFALRAIVTDATDAAIRSQINSDWNYLAAI